MRPRAPWLSALLLTLAILASPLGAQTTQPIDPTDGTVHIRATQAFNSGEYAIALPLLKKWREAAAKDDPERVGAIDERIRVCEKNLASEPAAEGAPPAPEPPPTAEERTAHPAPEPGKTVELTIKDLGNFAYDGENGGNIPADVKALNGATIRLTGFMIPMDQAENITQFALVPDLFACCFGAPPQVQHTVIVNCPAGKAVNYFPDEISVEGKLTVEEKKDEGYIVSLFEVEAASVKPAPK